MRRRGVIVAMAVAASSLFGPEARAAEPAGPPACAPHDLPEGIGLDGEPTPQLQGDVPQEHRVEDEDGRSRAEAGYNCGLALVGHTTLGRGALDPEGYERNASGNANMAWSQHCAYVSGPGTTFGPADYDPAADDPNGVAVVDVSDPRNPVHVRTLIGTGASTQTSETLFAVDVDEPGRERHVLVVGQYGNAGSGVMKPMDVYDVSDCADPRLLETFLWPENIHNLTISGNGRYVFATQPLQAVDIDPLFDADPATSSIYLGNIDRSMPYPVVSAGPFPDADDALPQPVREAGRPMYSSHQVWSSYDGTQLYMGGQLPTYEVFSIVDISDWLASRIPGTPVSTAPVEVLSQRNGRGHSVSVASVAGQGRWTMHAEESVFGQASSCHSEELNPFLGVAEPYFSDVTDPTNPRMHVGRFSLEINRPESCDAQRASGVQASVHYHEFDSETDARMAILSMQNAGIRVADIRDPSNPVEVGYFNPGDVDDGPDVALDYAWGHPRYVAETGHIWFATRAGGFWVVELEPQLRRHLGLHGGAAPVHPAGAPARAAVRIDGELPDVDVAPAYCTLGRVR